MFTSLSEPYTSEESYLVLYQVLSQLHISPTTGVVLPFYHDQQHALIRRQTDDQKKEDDRGCHGNLLF